MQPPLPVWDFSSILNKEEDSRALSDSAVQPWLRNIRFLWHDQQAMIRGPATRSFHLHFVQRWIHAFTSDNHAVRKLQLPHFDGGEVCNLNANSTCKAHGGSS